MTMEQYKKEFGSVPTKDFRIDLKQVNDDGTFEGILSVFNVVDLGGDLIKPGAFTKTIKEKGGAVPCLWQHDSGRPIGTLVLTETDEALNVSGKLALGVQQAREAWELLKAGVIRGLSIGYRAVKHERVNGIRHLKEIELFEGSIVTFPMLPLATVTSVKSATKADFIAELERVQLYAMRRMMIDAIVTSLDSIAWATDMDAATIVKMSGESITQFHDAYMDFLPKILDLWGIKRSPEATFQARLSAAEQIQVKDAIARLQALLTNELTSTDAATAKSAGDALEEEAATKTNEPGALHSWLSKVA